MPKKWKKLLRSLDASFFFIPFVAFAALFLGYMLVQAVFFQQNKIFPKGVRFVPDQIIVNYKDGQSPEELVLAGQNQKSTDLVTRLNTIGVLSQKKLFVSENELLGNYYVLSLKKGSSVPDVYNKLSQIPEIQAAAPDYILKIQEAPNDPYFASQWNLRMIQMPTAWDKIHVNNKVTVAVVDTGVDYTQEDLVGVVLKGKNYIKGGNNPMDDQGHGTHVAGILGAVTNNGIGVSGVSWGAKILAIKACDKNGDCNTSNVAKAIQYAVDSNVKIINVSIAGAGSCNGTYASVLAYAHRKGALVITAAGNGNNGDGVGVDAGTQIPAGCSGALAVGAVNAQDQRSPYSNFGSHVVLSAPGGLGPCSIPACILSTSLQNGYSLRAGTSMAAPHVSGVAALLLANNPSLSMDAVKTCLINGGDTIQTDQPVGPRLNALQSISLCTPSAAVPTPTASPNTSSISGTIYVDKNGNRRFDRNEKSFAGAQVILSGQSSDSIVTNTTGKYLFTNLAPGLYTVSVTVNGKSIGDPIDITLTGAGDTVIFDFPVPLNLAVTPTPSVSVQRPASECHIDPACLDPKNAFQVCSFQCP